MGNHNNSDRHTSQQQQQQQQQEEPQPSSRFVVVEDEFEEAPETIKKELDEKKKNFKIEETRSHHDASVSSVANRTSPSSSSPATNVVVQENVPLKKQRQEYTIARPNDEDIL